MEKVKEEIVKEKRHLTKTELEWILIVTLVFLFMGLFLFQYIRYLAKESAIKDMDMLENIENVIIAAMMDPEVMAANDDSKEQIEYLMSPGSKPLSSVESGTEFYYAVIETIGWNVFDPVEQRMHMRSAPAKNNGEIMIESTDGEYQMILWIIHSDFDGLGHDYDAADIQSLTNEIVNRGSYNRIHN